MKDVFDKYKWEPAHTNGLTYQETDREPADTNGVTYQGTHVNWQETAWK